MTALDIHNTLISNEGVVGSKEENGHTMKQTCLKLDVTSLDGMKQLVEKGYFVSMSEGIRFALYDFFYNQMVSNRQYVNDTIRSSTLWTDGKRPKKVPMSFKITMSLYRLLWEESQIQNTTRSGIVSIAVLLFLSRFEDVLKYYTGEY